jgi:hypothetical protein
MSVNEDYAKRLSDIELEQAVAETENAFKRASGDAAEALYSDLRALRRELLERMGERRRR